MITIREMQIDDLEQVMPIEEANFSIPWTETGFFTFLIRDDALFLVAEEDGEILGYLGILISFDESEITNVCVAEKARRRGIGRALMEELFRRMQERKVRVIHLDVRTPQITPISLAFLMSSTFAVSIKNFILHSS